VGRNRGFTGVLIQIQREAERKARAEVAAQRRAVRAADQARRAYELAQAAEEKERKRLYLEVRVAEVELLNQDLADDVAALESLLRDSLAVDDFLDFETLKRAAPMPDFVPGSLAVPVPTPDAAAFRPPEPRGAQKLLPGAKQRYLQKFEDGRVAYEAATREHAQRESERERRLAEARTEHERRVAAAKDELARQHAEIEAFKADFHAGRPDAVREYFALVLEASRYPDGFPQKFRLAFVPESRQLVIEYELPPFDRIPAVAEYKYVRTRDKISERSGRPGTGRRCTSR
jgi:restriction system protein